MVADKCLDVRQSGAELLVSMDAGCLINIGGALDKIQRTENAGTGKKAGPAWMPLPLFIQQRVTGGTGLPGGTVLAGGSERNDASGPAGESRLAGESDSGGGHAA